MLRCTLKALIEEWEQPGRKLLFTTFSVDTADFYELDVEPAAYNLASSLCAFKYSVETMGFRS